MSEAKSARMNVRLNPESLERKRALDSEPEVVPQLKAFIRRISEGSAAVPGSSGEPNHHS
jgi:hypothetical protein